MYLFFNYDKYLLSPNVCACTFGKKNPSPKSFKNEDKKKFTPPHIQI